jgi:tryptophan halogenase
MSDARVIKNITVIGGGSAGWLTALYARAVMPDKKITVIESDAIGILGAGEGTTPDLIRLFDALDIPLSRLIKETNCTVKNGIRFTNWNGGGVSDYFYHCFSTYGNLSADIYKLDTFITLGPSLYVSAESKGENFRESDVLGNASEENKVSFFVDPNKERRSEDPVDEYTNVAAFAVHFDAVLLAKFLKSLAKERGIERVEGLVETFTQDGSGDVKTIKLKSGKVIKTDFVFDCSGFASFFNKKFETEWQSHEEYLPTDAAVPFFIPIDKDIPSYTQAIAMKYGWMWKTPLQTRYGCGYVYDSSLITEEQAIQELEEYIGFEPEYPRKDKGGFKFNAGYYKEPWKSNVVSIGLSSGFVEPLEATSMWVSSTALARILGNPEIIHSKNPKVAREFNEWFCDMNDQVVDFIYYHFLTDRADTEFWKKFTKEGAPKGLRKFLDLFETRVVNSDDVVGSVWPLHSWYKVGLGHNNKDIRSNLRKSAQHNPAISYLNQNYEHYKQLQKTLIPTFTGHREFLEHLAGKPLQMTGESNG